MIVNINYKAYTNEKNVCHLKYNDWKPRQCILNYTDYKIIMFPNGKCRIMGCKKPIVDTDLPLNIKMEKMQSVTVCMNLKQNINLIDLAQKVPCSYEPELFPALRLTEFNPLCVNVFHTRKIVILGIKTLDYEHVVDTISLYILLSI